jgi:hypothetical protein
MDGICSAWATSCARIPESAEAPCTYITEHGVLLQGPSSAEAARAMLAKALPHPGSRTADMAYNGPLDACPGYYLVTVGDVWVLTKPKAGVRERSDRDEVFKTTSAQGGSEEQLEICLAARENLAEDAANAARVPMRRIGPRGETNEAC